MVEVTAAPADIVAAMLDQMGSLLPHVAQIIAPIEAARDRIRGYYGDRITVLPELGAPFTPVTAIDGANITDRLVVGDRVATLAVAVRTDPTGAAAVLRHHAWHDLHPHTPDLDTLARAVMMTDELSLLDAAHEDMALIDGAFPTHLIGIAAGLASTDETTREVVIERVNGDGVLGAIPLLARPNVVACPKSDSSMALWDGCAQDLDLVGRGLPDKALASLILHPGEVITLPSAALPWQAFHATIAKVSDPRARAVAHTLAAAAVPVIGDGTAQVMLTVPRGGTFAVKVEMPAATDAFTAADNLATIVAHIPAPHLQEPLPQYLADTVAKSLSAAAAAHMQQLRLDVANHDLTHLPYLTGYRTL